MSYEITWESEALAQAEQFAKDDPDGGRQGFTAVDRLAGTRGDVLGTLTRRAPCRRRSRVSPWRRRNRYTVDSGVPVRTGRTSLCLRITGSCGRGCQPLGQLCALDIIKHPVRLTRSALAQRAPSVRPGSRLCWES